MSAFYPNMVSNTLELIYIKSDWVILMAEEILLP